MPGGDRSGPLGMRPMTGGGAGFCTGLMSPGMAYGMGFGRGGRGFRRMYGFGAYAPMATAADEKAFLSSQAEFLENQLQQVKKGLKALAGDNE